MSPLPQRLFEFDFPVGLIRSPDKDRAVNLHRPAVGGHHRPGFRPIGWGWIVRQRSATAAMWAGVVPQQPPIPQAPIRASSSIVAANASGPVSNTVQPSTHTMGQAGIGIHHHRQGGASEQLRKQPFICSGPIPQLTPSASTRSPSRKGHGGGDAAAREQAALGIRKSWWPPPAGRCSLSPQAPPP